MKIYLDGADLKEIEELSRLGIIEGVTTNPSLIGGDVKARVQEICKFVYGSVSVEVVSTGCDGMLEEARRIAKIAPQVVVKLPITWDGLMACRTLSTDGIKTNMTLCFSVAQALLAARVGATYVSPFIGRLDDMGADGLGLVEDIRTVFDNYSIETKILAASIRSTDHISMAAHIGADVATAPYKIIKQMAEHPLTDSGLARFLSDAEKYGYKV